jgi:hypothetical protein
MLSQLEPTKLYGRVVPRHNSLEDHYQRVKQEQEMQQYEKAPIGGAALAIEKDNDPVNQPSHYTSGGIETIDFIEAKKLNYNLGNVIKYITRAGKKLDQYKAVCTNQESKDIKLQDLEKAVWYLQREIQNLKKA